MIEIIPPTLKKQENFTNYNYKGNNLGIMSIDSNNVSQYNHNQKTIKDKQMEKFANFVQPKINIYEGFVDWESAYSLTSSQTLI